MPLAISMAKKWIAVTVDVADPYSEIVANFLIESGAPGVALDEQDGHCRLTAHYVEHAPLDRIRTYCVEIGASKAAISTTIVSDQDWAESWKEHFHAIPVGARLWVCPPW